PCQSIDEVEATLTVITGESLADSLMIFQNVEAIWSFGVVTTVIFDELLQQIVITAVGHVVLVEGTRTLNRAVACTFILEVLRCDGDVAGRADGTAQVGKAAAVEGEISATGDVCSRRVSNGIDL